MFKLNRLTDYAVVLMSQMALEPRALKNANDLARDCAVPQPTVSKILNILAKADLVKGQRGAAGGYNLSRTPEDIPVSDIIEALEGPIALTACVEGTPEICGVEAQCPMRGHWNRVNSAIKEALDQVTLAEIAIAHTPLPVHRSNKDMRVPLL